MNKFFIIISIIFFGCALPNKQNIKRLNTDDFYGNGSIIGYFLPEIPEWIMVSESGQCSRDHKIKFLDMPTLRRSFALDYAKAHQMQLMFNMELDKKLKSLGLTYLPLKDEEALFYHILDQVTADFKVFRPPTFKKVNIIWIDPAINDQEIYLRLKNFVKSNAFDLGHPVFASSCLDQVELEKFSESLGIGATDIRFLSFEMFSIFNNLNQNNISLVLI